MASVGKMDPWVRWFNVSDPTKHSSGYTVYKITSKVFPVHSPEASTEITVWKRYNDFKKLHRVLSSLHYALHRPGQFPDFPKPIVFGRFDEEVIEERRKCALELLTFVGSNAHLFNSLAVQQFFATSETIDQEAVDESLTQEILQPKILSESVEEKTTPDNQEDISTQAQSVSSVLTTVNDEEDETNLVLSGTWTHRQKADSQSDSESLPSEEEEDVVNIDELDPLKASESNDDVTTSVEAATNEQLLASLLLDSTSDDSLTSQGNKQEKTIPASPDDNLDIYIHSKNDYLYQAVKQIRRAKRAETEAHYQVAFDCYKKAVSILLQGVQGDGDEERRAVVRKKTAEYLMYAEYLYKLHLDSDCSGSRWCHESSVPTSVARLRGGLTELSQYKVLGVIGGNMLVNHKETSNTFVIKVIQKNSNSESNAVKLIVPIRCSHMVKLCRYFETELSIYLLLEYSAGGSLWQHVYNYLQSCRQPSPFSITDQSPDNIYSGHKFSQVNVSSTQPTNDCSPEYLDMMLGEDNCSIVGQGDDNSQLLVSQAGGDNSPYNLKDGQKISQLDQREDDCQNDKIEGDDVVGKLTRQCSNESDHKRVLRRSSSSGRSVSAERVPDTSSLKHRAVHAFSYIESNNARRTHIPEHFVQKWSSEILMAILDLHKMNIILRDLSPDNILLDETGHILLTYFCQWPGVQNDVSTDSIAKLFVAPEVTLPGGQCVASDFWSFGVILYELVTGVSLVSVHPEGVTSHTILKLPEHLSTEAQHILRQLIRYNKAERLGGGQAGGEEIKAHPFFNGITWSLCTD